MLIIPYQQLSTEALQGLLEEVASRDGTDYGAVELSLEAKIAQLMQGLQTGRVLISFDHETESCQIISKEQYQQLFNIGHSADMSDFDVYDQQGYES